MARFDKLEFGGDSESLPEESSASLQPQDETHWLRLAEASRRDGLYENALRFYSRALELNTSLVGGWLGQTQMLVLLDEPNEAALWSQKALELFPNHGDLLAARAQAMCRVGESRQAHALCDASLKQPDQSAYRWLVRGEVMVAFRQEMDRHCFDKAQQLDRDWLVPLETALIYRHYRLHSKALLRARDAVERAPDSAYAWYVQGLCQLHVGMDDKARGSFRHCLELHPRHADATARLQELDDRRWSLKRFWLRIWNRF